MEKKEYKAPEMEIVDFEAQASLLSGSSEEPCDAEYCDELG
jgi:hypothetical protein